MSTCVRTCRAATWEVTSLYRGRRAGDEGGPFSTCHPPPAPGAFCGKSLCNKPSRPICEKGLCGWVLRGAPDAGRRRQRDSHGNLRRRREPGRLRGVRLPSSLDGCLVYSAVSLQSLLSLTPISTPTRAPRALSRPPASAPAVCPRCTPAPG